MVGSGQTARRTTLLTGIPVRVMEVMRGVGEDGFESRMQLTFIDIILNFLNLIQPKKIIFIDTVAP